MAISYHPASGFGNHLSSEAQAGALPLQQNSPQKTPFGLYAEQISGSAFTSPRADNRSVWTYRLQPSVIHGEYKIDSGVKHWLSTPFSSEYVSPNQLRWDPMPMPKKNMDWLTSMTTWCGHGDLTGHHGASIHLYACSESMKNRYFYNADAELLFVPQQGGLSIRTEMGVLEVLSGEIAVVPRGIKFSVDLLEDHARGYVCENYGQPLRLPELGPIGANGLAHARHFLQPVAAFEQDSTGEIIAKMHGRFWHAKLKSSPLNVVAWHGNYLPYKYDLRLFHTINTVSFDHPDPSIFTVLTSPSHLTGTANMDFVIFPARWMVAEHTFRPPYYHRNVMSEYMGLIYGRYDAKEAGFLPGGGSIHNNMSAHGPDLTAYQQGIQADLKPQYLADTLAFMFESQAVWVPTTLAMRSGLLQEKYAQCWAGLPPVRL